MNSAQDKLVAVLMNGGIAVLRTDTLYGIVARADDEQAVARVYEAKQRSPQKSCIILVGSVDQVYGDGAEFAHTLERLPGSEPASILLPADVHHTPSWLLRENDFLAHRFVTMPWLRDILTQTGPLIAPSANPEGESPARTIAEAKAYFGETIDYYLDGGEVPVDVSASRIIRLEQSGSIVRVR